MTIPGLDLRWRGGEFDDCPPEFQSQLQIACNHIESGRLQIAEGGRSTEFFKIDLAEFSNWALSLGWELPPRFPRTETMPAPPETEIAASAQERREAGQRPAASPTLAQKETPREARKRKKREMYDTWHRLAVEHCLRDNGEQRTREQIAKKIANDEGARDPLSGKPPDADTVKRRLDLDYRGWAEKSWAERASRKNLPGSSN
jgi:hypothetical protein